MQQTSRFLLVVLALSAILLSACGGAAVATNPGSPKVQPAPVQYTGVLEGKNGTLWVVNGQPITVDPSVVRDGPFQVGDSLKVEVVVNPDGSLTVSRVESPSATDLSVLPQFGDDNSNNANSNGDNANDVNSNDDYSNNANSNDVNSNDANSNASNTNEANSNDAGGSEILGTVEAITDSSITINGQTYNFQAGGAETKGNILLGAFVKIHLQQNADGTFTVRQIELSDPSQIGNDNSNNANSNSNDDNSSNSGNDNAGGGGNTNSGGGNDNGGGGGNTNGGGGGGNTNGGGGGNDNGGGGNNNGGG